MKNLVQKLPNYFQSNLIFSAIFDKISNAKCMYSSSICTKQGKQYLINKVDDMHIPIDWQAYSLLRATAKLAICSGQIFRAEPTLFLSRQSFGNPNVQELYKELAKQQTQKLMILSRKLKPSQIKQFVNQSYYCLVKPPVFSSISDLINSTAIEPNLPALIQFGTITMQQYLSDVLKGMPNKIDTILISKFIGNIPDRYIGNQFSLPLCQLYKKIWESQQIPCRTSNGIEGKLIFQILNPHQ